MSSVLPSSSRPMGLDKWAVWWPVALGLLVLYVPTFVDLARTTWEHEEGSHGPIVLAILLWLAWQARTAFTSAPVRPSIASGSASLVLGLAAYILGRSQAIQVLEVGSLMLTLAGTILLTRGWAGLRTVAFPIFFVVFLIPLPGILVTAITGSLKQQVSVVAEYLLYVLGYPIARSGVVLSVGPYELMVADACSGLNSMYSLSALGLLYIYMMRYRNWLRIGVLLASILPIAFAANIVRVLILVLVTYHFGDEAGQGFLHGFAGIVLFIVALSMLLLLDKLLSFIPLFSDLQRGPRLGESK